MPGCAHRAALPPKFTIWLGKHFHDFDFMLMRQDDVIYAVCQECPGGPRIKCFTDRPSPGKIFQGVHKHLCSRKHSLMALNHKVAVSKAAKERALRVFENGMASLRQQAADKGLFIKYSPTRARDDEGRMQFGVVCDLCAGTRRAIFIPVAGHGHWVVTCMNHASVYSASHEGAYKDAKRQQDVRQYCKRTQGTRAIPAAAPKTQFA